MLEDDYLDVLNKEFKLKDKDALKGVPSILYYKNGEFVKTITSDKQMMRVDDLQELLDS